MRGSAIGRWRGHQSIFYAGIPAYG
jgi:hypothetical protein